MGGDIINTDVNLLLITKAYELFERTAPLSYDCGRLCGSRCCKGSDNTGMWLFPDEEKLLKDTAGFEIKDCESNFGYKMLVCRGFCERKTRPLSCRIFPYFPMISGGDFDARADIRGISICPLLCKNIKPEYAFIRQVRKAARLISQSDEIREYIINVNSILDEIGDFAERTV